MEKFFYPRSIVIMGLSAKAHNIPKLVLENLLRWGYRGRIFGVNPKSDELPVGGVKMYRELEDLPEVPDLAVCLIPARFVPETVEKCGKLGITRMAILSGGFSEFGEEGKKWSDLLMETARKYGIRFVGPNGLATTNTANGLCLPFIPLYPPAKGGMSVITQSGGVGLTLWNVLADENVGMAKFVSIGNKLDLDEVDFLEYLGQDPETTIICLYLESIRNGSRLIDVAGKIRKPIVVYKANTTAAGGRAALSHTASLSSDEDIIDAAFEEAGIIRIRNYGDLLAVAKVFELPPMRGNRIMVMSPAGDLPSSVPISVKKQALSLPSPVRSFIRASTGFPMRGSSSFPIPSTWVISTIRIWWLT